MVEQLCPHCAGERTRIYRPGAPEDLLKVTSLEAAAEILLPPMQDLDREHSVTLNLDTRHVPARHDRVHRLGQPHVHVAPRGVP